MRFYVGASYRLLWTKFLFFFPFCRGLTKWCGDNQDCHCRFPILLFKHAFEFGQRRNTSTNRVWRFKKISPSRSRACAPRHTSETKKNAPGGLWRHGHEPTAHAPPHVRWRGRLYLKSRVLSERRREESSAVKRVVEDMLCSSFLAAVFDVFIVDIFFHVDKINPWGRRPISLQYFPLPIHLSLRECVRVYEWMNIRVSFFFSVWYRLFICQSAVDDDRG